MKTSKISLKKLESQAQSYSSLLSELVFAVIKQEVSKVCKILDETLKDIGNYEWFNLLSIAVSASNKEMVREMFYRKPVLQESDFFGLLSIAAGKNDPDLFSLLCHAHQIQTGHLLEIKMNDLPLIKIAASGDIEKFKEEFQNYPNQENIRWQLILDAAAQNGHQDMFDHVFNLTPNQDDIFWPSIVSGAVRSSGESIFHYIFKKIPNDFVQHIKSAISDIPNYISNLEVFKILQNFSKQIAKYPEIENIEIELNPERHSALVDLSAIYRTNKTLHDTIEAITKPSTEVKPLSTDQLSQLPQELREKIISYL